MEHLRAPRIGFISTLARFMKPALVSFVFFSLNSCSMLPSQIEERKADVSLFKSYEVSKLFSSESREFKTLHAKIFSSLSGSELAEYDLLLNDIYQTDNTFSDKVKIALLALRHAERLEIVRGDGDRFWRSLRNLRMVGSFYQSGMMERLSQIDSQSALNLFQYQAFSERPDSDLKRLESSLEFFSRALLGIGVKLGKVRDFTPEQRSISKKIEAAAVQMDKPLFNTVLQNALTVTNKVQTESPANSTTINKTLAEVAVSAFTLGSTLDKALKQNLILENEAKESIEQWSNQIASVASGTISSTVASAIAFDVPDEIPTIDPSSAKFSGDLSKWSFKASKSPKFGVLDLNQNPPVYVPGSDFPDGDNYAVRVCNNKFEKLCSDEFSKIITRPSPPTIPSLPAPLAGFYPNSAVVCASNAANSEPLEFKFYSNPPGSSSVVALSDAGKSNSFINAGLPADTQVWCEVHAVGEYGLKSSVVKSSNLIVPNSPPSLDSPIISQQNLGEDSSLVMALGVAQEIDGDQVIWVIDIPPTKGSLTPLSGIQSAPASQS
ncbi:MAG: hypothetical protein RI953_1407, partial [Pseudomonadota bacterium]